MRRRVWRGDAGGVGGGGRPRGRRPERRPHLSAAREGERGGVGFAAAQAAALGLPEREKRGRRGGVGGLGPAREGEEGGPTARKRTKKKKKWEKGFPKVLFIAMKVFN